ncbi:sensor histidine kinase [Scleromatobacter humisilvae]|uniref:Histidine kinase n=1 Tax=Scleromatobacter humisilvae TaxID=2897159 RepID=A0A9X1YJP4_9BURK|nr:histidine kinase [Scleromatobacter humisilvae]MCK9686640.1 histidine kinase [Scleromatobacter humisilvae]
MIPTSPLRTATLRASWIHWAGIGSPGGSPAWVQVLWTMIYAAIVATGFTVLSFALNAHSAARWFDLHEWLVVFGTNFVISLTIAFIIQGMFLLGRRTIGHARIQAFGAWQRTLYFAGIPIVGSLVGWPTGVSLVMGNLDFVRRMTSSELASSLLLSVLISAMFLLYFSLRVGRARADMRANEAQLRLLQGQMEPHFLFNTLANVISLIDADAPRAKHTLEALTDYLRASLGGLRRDDSTLAGELDLARRYLQLMQTRMGERLRFEIEADDALGRAALMPLVLQPLIENAVKHGLEPQVDGGTVRVKATRVMLDGEDCLQVCIEDDGAGLAAAARRPRRRVAGGADGNGIALANLRERLQARFGGSARLTLTELGAGTGTRACIVVPWQLASAA